MMLYGKDSTYLNFSLMKPQFKLQQKHQKYTKTPKSKNAGKRKSGEQSQTVRQTWRQSPQKGRVDVDKVELCHVTIAV